MRIDGLVSGPAPSVPRDYEAMNKVVRKHKGALTRARKKGPRAVILAVRDAFKAFDEPDMIWPDNWHTWNVAAQDAIFALRGEDFDISDKADHELLHAVRYIEGRS